MRLDVVTVGELPWQEYAARPCKFLRHLNRAEETALFMGDKPDGSAVAFHQPDPFLAHPVRHIDDDLVPEVASNRGKRNSSISAGCLRNSVAGVNSAVQIGLF